jgi:hypothetical protein
MGRICTLVFYAGAVWETGRFFFLFQLVSAVVNPLANFISSLLILWLGSGQLCAGLLFFLCGYMPGKFFRLRKITAVFTFMGILPALGILIIRILAPGVLAMTFPPARFPPVFATTLILVCVDVFFLAYLLLSHGEDTECT